MPFRDRDQHNAYFRVWRAKNKEKIRQQRHRRYAQMSVAKRRQRRKRNGWKRKPKPKYTKHCLDCDAGFPSGTPRKRCVPCARKRTLARNNRAAREWILANRERHRESQRRYVDRKRSIFSRARVPKDDQAAARSRYARMRWERHGEQQRERRLKWYHDNRAPQHAYQAKLRLSLKNPDRIADRINKAEEARRAGQWHAAARISRTVTRALLAHPEMLLHPRIRRSFEASSSAT